MGQICPGDWRLATGDSPSPYSYRRSI
jgi:hypothetical protein